MRKRYEPVHAGEDDDEEVQLSKKRNPRSKFRITGWRFGVLCCALTASAAFITNLLITLITVGIFGIGENGRQILYSGNCNTVERLNTVAHLIINVLSTILLSSSNYSMQCISAPTRTEVDKAHCATRRPKWMDIGVPSIYNLFLTDKERVLLWTLLVLSSVPLHLLYVFHASS